MKHGSFHYPIFNSTVNTAHSPFSASDDNLLCTVSQLDPPAQQALFPRLQALLASSSVAVRGKALEGLIEIVEAREPDDPEALVSLPSPHQFMHLHWLY